MAVSKRIRYEVLRRCNYACYYCGLPAPATVLEVDHVTPRSLGGTDDAFNLVAACPDCNNGKRDSVPNQELLDRVRSDYCAVVPAFDDEYCPASCTVCGQVIACEKIDDPSDAQCMRCNAAVCDAYEAGIRWGKSDAIARTWVSPSNPLVAVVDTPRPQTYISKRGCSSAEFEAMDLKGVWG